MKHVRRLRRAVRLLHARNRSLTRELVAARARLRVRGGRYRESDNGNGQPQQAEHSSSTKNNASEQEDRL